MEKSTIYFPKFWKRFAIDTEKPRIYNQKCKYAITERKTEQRKEEFYDRFKITRIPDFR